MRLADDITITLDHETIYLRPSLWAAFRLERRYGFDKIIQAIAGGNLAIMADVIRESSDQHSTLPDFLDCISSLGTLPLLAVMIAFGAAFGYTVMARMSLLIGRLTDLIEFTDPSYGRPSLWLLGLTILILVVMARRSSSNPPEEQ